MRPYLHYWESSQRELRLIFRTPLDGLSLGRPLAVKRRERGEREGGGRGGRGGRRERGEGGRGGKEGEEGERQRTLR